jgi:surface antigen
MQASTRRGIARARVAFARVASVAVATLPLTALATPPDWAPAHGWRKQHDPDYAGYSGHAWTNDYGVQSGRCDREQIGALLGGLAGGIVGSEVAGGDGRAVAIAVGTLIGAAIGADIGRRMDRTDRACTGHALELASTGKSVTWINRASGITYTLTPLDATATAGGCRRFKLLATGPFGLSEGRAQACPDATGTWTLAPEAKVSRR